MTQHTIAVIPGDGIGREVIPEGVRVPEAVGAKHGIQFRWQEYPWSCDWYKAHGRMCPEDAPDILKKSEAVFFGAVGNPSIVPDHISAWGLLINFRSPPKGGIYMANTCTDEGESYGATL